MRTIYVLGAGVRAMVRENSISAANLMQPLFIHDDDEVVAIGARPSRVS